MGMWLVQNLKEELCPDKDYDTIVKDSMTSTYEEVLDCDDPSLLAPKSMVEAFNKLLKTNKLAKLKLLFNTS